jgi:hypothetical protein
VGRNASKNILTNLRGVVSFSVERYKQYVLVEPIDAFLFRIEIEDTNERRKMAAFTGVTLLNERGADDQPLPTLLASVFMRLADDSGTVFGDFAVRMCVHHRRKLSSHRNDITIHCEGRDDLRGKSGTKVRRRRRDGPDG